jgi:CheY-like chemotaxis protein
LRRVVEAFQQGKSSTLTWDLLLEGQLFAAKYDEAKMQQVFVRIIENSVEALHDAGRITIVTRNVEFTEPARDGAAQLNPGSYVCVEITDDGLGIDPAILPRIFEPFFSTKQGHRGLGLAWVYGIVTNHRGGVTVSSVPGEGTSTRIYLPASRQRIADTGDGLTDLRGNQTILMVDDEDLLLNMGRVVLGQFGYEVLTANSGAKALALLEKLERPIDLVITDLVMPQMSGREFIDQIQLRLPGVPVLCSSGFARGADGSDTSTFLPKPFTSQELLTRVRQLLAP